MKFLNKNRLEQLFWFLVLVSWIPVIASYSILPSFSESQAEGAVAAVSSYGIFIPEPIYYKYFIFNPFVIVFLVAVLLGWKLNRMYLEDTQAEYLAKHSRRKKIPKEVLDEINKKKIPYFIAATPLLTVSIIPLFNNISELSSLQSLFYATYMGSFLVSVFLYLRYSHLISTAFVCFCLFMLIDSMALYISHTLNFAEDVEINHHYSVFGALYELYVTDILNVLMFILIAALVRLLYLIASDNWYYFKETEGKDLFKFSIGTFKLWYPMLIIFVFFTFIYQLIYTHKLEPALVTEINQSNAGLDAQNTESHPKILEEALLSVNTNRLNTLKEATDAQINALNLSVQDGVNQAPQKIHNELNQALPKRLPGTKIEGCFFINIGCHIENGLKSSANSAYVSVKHRQLTRLKQKLESIKNDTTTTVEQKATTMNEALANSLSEMERMNQTAIQSSFDTFKRLSHLLFIYTLIILAKTFMIVFSRVSFSPETKKYASFKRGHQSEVYGSLKKLNSQFKLSTKDDKTYFFARSDVTISGAPPARVTPMRFAAFFTRLFNGRLSLNKVVPGNSSKGVEVSVDEPAQFVVWELKYGERVFFDFSDFIGMSEGLQIKRMVSLSVSTLLFGKIIHYYIEGPGKLFLKTRAQAAISPEDAVTAGHNSAKLVAWHKNTNFDIDSSKTKIDTFLSDYNVKPLNPKKDMVVFDLSKKRGTSKTAGIMKFTKSFMLPL